MSHKQFVQCALKDVLNSQTVSLDTVTKYFSKEYLQIVDGKAINFDEFVEHLKVLKEATHTITITIKSIAENDNCVHTQHLAKAIKKDGSVSLFEVFAKFQLENGLIVRCEELTRMLDGDESDSDLGSRSK